MLFKIIPEFKTRKSTIVNWQINGTRQRERKSSLVRKNIEMYTVMFRQTKGNYATRVVMHRYKKSLKK